MEDLSKAAQLVKATANRKVVSPKHKLNVGLTIKESLYRQRTPFQLQSPPETTASTTHTP